MDVLMLKSVEQTGSEMNEVHLSWQFATFFNPQ